MSTPFRLLVFDWDGTLRDSIASIVGCAMEAVAEIGLVTTPERVRATVGLGMEESVRLWIDDPDDLVVARVIESYRRRWIDDWHARGRFYDGVPEMLEELAGADHLLAVATGKSRIGLRRDFAGLPSAALFAATRTADETAAKPSPVMLLELMSELGARPDETLMVGDTSHDLWMAKNAGVPAVAVLGGAMGRDELLPHALACLERVTELPAWLRGAPAGDRSPLASAIESESRSDPRSRTTPRSAC